MSFVMKIFDNFVLKIQKKMLFKNVKLTKTIKLLTGYVWAALPVLSLYILLKMAIASSFLPTLIRNLGLSDITQINIALVKGTNEHTNKYTFQEWNSVKRMKLSAIFSKKVEIIYQNIQKLWSSSSLAEFPKITVGELCEP